MRFTHATLALCLIGLSGCVAGSPTEKDFLCEAQIGTPCTTMSEADGGSGGSLKSIAEKPADTLAGTISQEPLMIGKNGSVSGFPSGMPSGGTPYVAKNYRLPEKLGVIWVAPHLDAAGLLHESTFVHFVIHEAEWAGGK